MGVGTNQIRSAFLCFASLKIFKTLYSPPVQPSFQFSFRVAIENTQRAIARSKYYKSSRRAVQGRQPIQRARLVVSLTCRLRPVGCSPRPSSRQPNRRPTALTPRPIGNPTSARSNFGVAMADNSEHSTKRRALIPNPCRKLDTPLQAPGHAGHAGHGVTRHAGGPGQAGPRK